MTSRSSSLLPIRLPPRAPRLRRIAPAALAAVLEAAAAGALMAARPWAVDAVAAAAALHLAAALAVAGFRPARDGRRLLGAGAVLAMPGVGPGIAAAVLATRGGVAGATGNDFEPAGARGPAARVGRRAGETLPDCDALLDGDDEQRGDALARMAGRADDEGLAVLRWAAAGRDPDLALLAALALDEISERDERAAAQRALPREVRHVAG